ncbi:MAG: AMP-binding protein [Christensenellaceae bacterium]|jgi:fatty-acyl-CoA synthase|nr:AMP-binding protein [Christensenellaceae bacterium]
MERLIRKTVGGLLEDIATKHPFRPAVKYIEADYSRTYYDFNRDCDDIARGLLGMGFQKGDKIAVWATNLPEWLILFFATAKIGVILATVNTNYKENELAYLLENSDSKAIFICDGLKDIDCEKIIYSLCPELKTCDPGRLKTERFPFLTHVISFDNHYKGMYHWKDIKDFGVLLSDKKFAAAKAAVDPDEVINMQYTSGTTGLPKGVQLTHFNIVNNGMQIGDCMKFTDHDRLCIPVPFFHCFGMVLGIMACVTHATAMVPLFFYTPMKVMHAIEYEKCTAVHGVPTMFIAILEHRDFNKYNFSSLRTGIMAGSPCPEPIMRKVIDKMNMREITITYGQTEASPACTMSTVDDDLEHKVTTVGKGLAFQEAKIFEPGTNNELPAGVSGEFCVKGYNVMKGYYKMPKATADTIDAEGWLRTGDMALKTEDGYYKITGRIKDMIIRGGENIFPKEIEDFLLTHEGVKDAQIVAVPSERYGEEAFAFIVKRAGYESLTEKDIRKYILDRLARHKVPTYISFINEFPMTASGKIQKFLLREEAKKLAGASGTLIDFKD